MGMSRNEQFNSLSPVNAIGIRKMLYVMTAGFFLLIAGSVLGADLSVLHANQVPTRLARGPGGKIYVTDPQAGAVFIYDSDLNAIGELKNLNLPLGIAVGVDGTMYVGCRGTHAVQVYDANGDFIMNIGEDELSMPSDIALDLHGNLYVADSAAHCIRLYNMSGGHLGDIGSFGTADAPGWRPSKHANKSGGK